jgi:hypothetical protein
VIELDLSSPWEPPEPPRAPLRFRLRTRWLAALTVLAVASVLLVAAGAAPPTGPLYTIEHQVRSVIVADDMLIVSRYREGVTDPRLEGRRRSDGTVLWSVHTDLQQQYAAVNAKVLLVAQYSSADLGYSSTLTAFETTTGRRLWTLPRMALLGTGRGLIVVEEMIEPDRVVEFPAGMQPPDPTVNDAGDPQPRHIQVLDERTAAPVWELTAPAGTAVDLAWDGRYPTGRVTGIDQLDPSGLVTRRDIRTGAVTSTHQLDWSGVPAMFSSGASWPFGPGAATPAQARVMVYPDGERGGLVFSLADGRRLFRTDVAIYDGLYQCAAEVFCASNEHGVAAYDSGTGRPLWRLDRYTQVAAARGDRLVMNTYEEPGSMSGPLGLIDARTGAVTADLAGWRLIDGTAAERILLWRAVDERTAILGELNPATGRITVFGRAGDWYGPPECSVAGDTLACVMVGDLTVWRLPARH